MIYWQKYENVTSLIHEAGYVYISCNVRRKGRIGKIKRKRVNISAAILKINHIYFHE
jgi:hypothetical protein